MENKGRFIMRIGIVGGGAIGLLYANYLREKYDVTIFTRTQEQAELLNRDGLNFIVNGQVQTKKVKANQISEAVTNEELLIVTVKQYHLSDLYPFIKNVTSPLLFLQNGYGHIEFLKALNSRSIFVGVIEHGALKHNQNTVEHTGLGRTKLAIFRGDWKDLRIINEQIESFPFELKEDFHLMLLEKLIVNAVINPITAILGVPNGELVKNPFYQQLMDKYVQELAEILQIQHVADTLEHVKQVCKMTAGNRSSMLKDIENGRKTEIDAILGYVLQVAEQTGKEQRLTQFLYTMIKGKEVKKG